MSVLLARFTTIVRKEPTDTKHHLSNYKYIDLSTQVQTSCLFSLGSSVFSEPQPSTFLK
jgi:hypothetical protein